MRIPRVQWSGCYKPAAGSHFAMDPLRAPETIRISTMAKTRMVSGALKQCRAGRHFRRANFPLGANFFHGESCRGGRISFMFSLRFVLEPWRNRVGIVEESWRNLGAGCAAVAHQCANHSCAVHERAVHREVVPFTTRVPFKRRFYVARAACTLRSVVLVRVDGGQNSGALLAALAARLGTPLDALRPARSARRGLAALRSVRRAVGGHRPWDQTLFGRGQGRRRSRARSAAHLYFTRF